MGRSKPLPYETVEFKLTASLIALKSSTNSVRALLCVSRSYVDVFSGAVAFTVVIHAVLHVTVNALIVLATALVICVHAHKL